MPAKVVLQLTTAFREGGLCNRTGNFSYKDHLRECQTPVLALAGDKDLICPPEAVYGRACTWLLLSASSIAYKRIANFILVLYSHLAETVKLIPQRMVNYRVFGNPEGPHYAHYDLVGGRLVRIPCLFTSN